MFLFVFFFQAEDGIRDLYVTGVQTCALPIVYLPPDLVTKILSIEWGISVRAMIMTFLEMLLLMRIRSPSRIVARFSLFRLGFMRHRYDSQIRQSYFIFIRCPTYIVIALLF